MGYIEDGFPWLSPGMRLRATNSVASKGAAPLAKRGWKGDNAGDRAGDFGTLYFERGGWK
jgi:hypothetical protein